MAHEVLLRTEIPVTSVIPGTTTPTLVVVVPSPSWPESFEPKQKTTEFVVSVGRLYIAQACTAPTDRLDISKRSLPKVTPTVGLRLADPMQKAWLVFSR